MVDEDKALHMLKIALAPYLSPWQTLGKQEIDAVKMKLNNLIMLEPMICKDQNLLTNKVTRNYLCI